MKFYYNKDAPPDRRWQKTQADAKQLIRHGDGTEYAIRDVPTGMSSTPNLATFLNAMEYKLTQQQQQDVVDEDRVDRSLDYEAGYASDGHPEHRSAYTSAQVNAAALPRSTKVQDICHEIGKLSAADLGYVALEVVAHAARMTGVRS